MVAVARGESNVAPPARACRTWVAALAAAWAAGCATAPPPAVTAAPPPPTYEQKMAAILHLEDRRVLSDDALTPPTVTSLPPLLLDGQGRIRRRAALAIGRTGVADGVAPLTALLAKDTEAEVRVMAAFALGLLGDAGAAPALMTALSDPDPRVQGRAAEALGLIGHGPAAGAIAGMASQHVRAGALAGIAADDETWPLAPPVEAVRLGVFALVRLDAFDELRAVVIGADGLPASDWWPLAYALQRIARPAAVPTLRTWLTRGGATTRAFAARGLGVLKAADARPTLETLAADERQPLGVRVQAVRALAAIDSPQSAPALAALFTKAPVLALRLEAATALGAVADPAAAEVLVDFLEHRTPPLRAAAQAALARADAETFLTVLSGLDVDPEWRVRAALATTLGTLGKEAASLRLGQLARDADARVRAAALTSLARVGAAGADTLLTAELQHKDPVVRAAAARGLATLEAVAAVPALTRALDASRADPTYVARTAVLAALTALDAAAARPLVQAALADPEWAVRVRAATLLREIDPASTAGPQRPAPAPANPALDAPAALLPPAYTPQAYVQTSKGEIRFDLAIVDAPRTVANFIALAEKGFFNGLAWHRIVPDFVVQSGDPRGDGEGGPGYTVRDELSMRPFLRGTVGIALDWRDTGGSQFFITHSPQPHLDARYPVLGQVAVGMDVVDRLEPGDRIVSVRVWDGVRWIGREP
jgi:cyclophilin family peptidyl-prolyl cis-trans isomerase/HEAT repeat protein